MLGGGILPLHWRPCGHGALSHYILALGHSQVTFPRNFLIPIRHLIPHLVHSLSVNNNLFHCTCGEGNCAETRISRQICCSRFSKNVPFTCSFFEKSIIAPKMIRIW